MISIGLSLDWEFGLSMFGFSGYHCMLLQHYGLDVVWNSRIHVRMRLLFTHLRVRELHCSFSCKAV